MDFFDKLGEECGIFGMIDPSYSEVAPAIYYGLLALQHRGQESCGIAVDDMTGPKRQVKVIKAMGLVNEVFSHHELKSLTGNIGIGHVRYSTTGESSISNAQPLVLRYIKGTLSLAHNGNLINAQELIRELEQNGCIFQSTIDTEVIAYLIARERVKAPSAEAALLAIMKKLKGAYSLVVMSPKKLMGARDCFGFKPLCIGKRDQAYILASESAAIETVGGKFIRDVMPGEVVTIDEAGLRSDCTMCKDKKSHARCIFEYIYFSRPDSFMDGIGIYDSRIRAGKFLAMDSPVEADVVVGVPDSGYCAAIGFSQATGIPYGQAFHKNSYVGRTFIKPRQSDREDSVNIKLNPMREAVEGKRVVMIDDSIVRGTTSDRIVKLLRDAGAVQVHMRVSSPPFRFPCYFGTDVPAGDQLIINNRSIEDVRKIIGADSLAYLREERLEEIVNGLSCCKGCFSGKYPIEPPKTDIRGEFEA